MASSRRDADPNRPFAPRSSLSFIPMAFSESHFIGHPSSFILARRRSWSSSEVDPLPAPMNKRPDLLIVNVLQLSHRFRRNGRKIRGAAVVSHLLRSLSSRDRATHRFEHQNPAQSKLSHRNASGQQGADLFNGFETSV